MGSQRSARRVVGAFASRLFAARSEPRAATESPPYDGPIVAWTKMSSFFWPTVLALAAGAIAGACSGLIVSGRDSDDAAPESRGAVVRLGLQLGYGPGDEPWCNAFHHFCVSHPRDGEKPIAFYTFTTHDRFRQEGCQVRWLKREELSDGILSLIGDATGAYR